MYFLYNSSEHIKILECLQLDVDGDFLYFLADAAVTAVSSLSFLVYLPTFFSFLSSATFLIFLYFYLL